MDIRQSIRNALGQGADISPSNPLQVQLVPSILTVGTVTISGTIGTYQVELDDATSGALSRTMPTAPVKGVFYYVKKIDASANTVTYLPQAGATIEGGASLVFYAQNETAILIWDGVSNWAVF